MGKKRGAEKAATSQPNAEVASNDNKKVKVSSEREAMLSAILVEMEEFTSEFEHQLEVSRTLEEKGDSIQCVVCHKIVFVGDDGKQSEDVRECEQCRCVVYCSAACEASRSPTSKSLDGNDSDDDGDSKDASGKGEEDADGEEKTTEGAQNPWAKYKAGTHSEWACGQLALALECESAFVENEIDATAPLWMNYEAVEPTAELPGTWQEYAKARGMPEMEDLEIALATVSLSFPMTALFALETLRPKGFQKLPTISACTMTTFRIHVIGAESSEMEGVEKWMEVLYNMPKVKTLDILFVGPEVPENLDSSQQSFEALTPESEEDKSSVQSKGKGQQKKAIKPQTVQLTWKRGLYHEAFGKEFAFQKPHMALAFNSGLCNFLDSWAESVKFLIHRNIPCCFTSYTPQEHYFDSALLSLRFGAAVTAAGPNPFRSLVPIVDSVFPHRTYNSNGFFTLFQGRVEE